MDSKVRLFRGTPLLGRLPALAALLLAAVLAAASCTAAGPAPPPELNQGRLRVRVAPDLSLMVERADGPRVAGRLGLEHGGRAVSDFHVTGVAAREDGLLRLRAESPGGPSVTLELCTLGEAVRVDVEASAGEALRWDLEPTGLGSGLWAFQGGVERWGEDFVGPLAPGAKRGNRWGALGGIPAVDVYGSTGGIFVGALAASAPDAALPVEWAKSVRIGFQERFHGSRRSAFLLILHDGDFFAPLARYAEHLRAAGLALPRRFPAAAWLQSWETYGYEEDWKVSDIVSRLDTLRGLGIGAVTVDSGWYEDFLTGDYEPDPEKLPQGMRALVDRIHRAGLQARLWWQPGLVEHEAELARAHPEWLILGPDGKPTDAVTATREAGDYYLCPALPAVQDFHRRFTRKALAEWGFDGFKMDFLYSVAPCHARAHGHATPWDSVRAHPEVFRAVQEVAGDRVLEICNCGVAQNLFLMPHANLVTVSDPVGGRQARWRAKVLKALLGPTAPVLGDHVELTRLLDPEENEREGPPDFASLLGVGAVLQTKYTALSDAEAALYRKWLRRGAEWRLSSGEYLGGLYAIGVDLPEAHAIRVGDAVRYAFYTDAWGRRYVGTVELRGLAPGRRFEVRDAETDAVAGVVTGPCATLPARFTSHLLLVARPAAAP